MDNKLTPLEAELLAAAKMALTLIDDMMPGVRDIALPDYALLNNAPLSLRAAIARAEGKAQP